MNKSAFFDFEAKLIGQCIQKIDVTNDSIKLTLPNDEAEYEFEGPHRLIGCLNDFVGAGFLGTEFRGNVLVFRTGVGEFEYELLG